jgi:hypothetical protein
LSAKSFCSLGVFYGGLGISKIQFLIRNILIIKDPELDPDPQLEKMLDPDPH